MADLEKHAEPAVAKLLQSDEDQLFAQLGIRQQAIQADPSQAGKFETTTTYQANLMGPMNVLHDFGKAFFDRVNKDVYALVCGDDPENAGERKKIMDAFGLGDAGIAAAIAASAVGWFGWAPAIAAVVAALVVKLFFKNGAAEACKVWKQHLPA